MYAAFDRILHGIDHHAAGLIVIEDVSLEVYAGLRVLDQVADTIEIGFAAPDEGCFALFRNRGSFEFSFAGHQLDIAFQSNLFDEYHE